MFATPDGLNQYTVLPFGVHGAPVTSQWMMDREYTATYIDDIVIHSNTWALHLHHLRAILGQKVPPGPGRGLLSGLPGREGQCKNPERKSADHPDLAQAQNQETGEVVPWARQVLPEIHPRFRNAGQPPP